MKLVITGGSGFLGYHLCKVLSPRYDHIYVFDRAPLDLKEYPPNVQFVQADVRNRKKLSEVCKGAQFVIHAAAALPLWPKKEIYSINIQGTQTVLEVALKEQVERVVFISSTAVYGVPQRHSIVEEDLLVGVGAYGESKIAAEKLCQKFRRKGLCVSVVRPKTFIGTGRLGVFQILYDWIEHGKKIPIIGDGTNRYQLLEVEDLVNAIECLLEGDCLAVNDTFNVGAEEFRTVAEDVGALCYFSQKGSKILKTRGRFVKPLLYIFDKLKLSPLYQWVYDTADKDSYVSIDKIEGHVGWKPQYSNAQALIRSYQWYLTHKEQSGPVDIGITHRVGWDQGILKIVKRFL